MAAADRTEKVLRELHILFSKAPSFEGSRTNVVLDKNVVIDKLRDLRQCMYDMMNEYELTVQSREKANREAQRENDERVLAATKHWNLALSESRPLPDGIAGGAAADAGQHGGDA